MASGVDRGIQRKESFPNWSSSSDSTMTPHVETYQPAKGRRAGRGQLFSILFFRRCQCVRDIHSQVLPPPPPTSWISHRLGPAVDAQRKPGSQAKPRLI